MEKHLVQKCLIVILVSLLVVLFFRIAESESDTADSGPNEAMPNHQQVTGTTLSAATSRERSVAGSPEIVDPFAVFMTEYNSLSRRYDGSELDTERLRCVARHFRQLPPLDRCAMLDYVLDDFDESDLGSLTVGMGSILLDAEETGDSDGVHRWLFEHENAVFQSELLQSAGRSMGLQADFDPIFFYKKIPTVSAKDHFLAGYFGTFGDDARNPIASLIGIEPEGGSYPRLVQIFNEIPLSPEHFSSVRQQLLIRSESFPKDILGMLVGKWTDGDAKAAAGFVAAMSQSEVDRALLATLESGGEKLVSLMEAWPSSDERDIKIVALVQSSVIRSPNQSWQLGLMIKEKQARDEILTQVYHEWAAKDKPAADAAWVEAAASP